MVSKRQCIPDFLANQTAYYMKSLPNCRAYWTTIADLENIRIFYEKPDGSKDCQLFPRLDDASLLPLQEKDKLEPQKTETKANDKFFTEE